MRAAASHHLAASPLRRRRRAALRPEDFWQHAWVAASALMMVLSVRLTEVVPFLAAMRPALLSICVAAPLLALRSGPTAVADVKADPTVKLLVLYGTWAAIGVPFALWQAQAWEGITLIPLGTGVVVAILLCPRTVQCRDRLAAVFLASAVAMGLLTYAQGMYVDAEGRLTTGGAYDPNDLASLMATVFPFALVRVLRGGFWSRLAGAAAGGALLTVLGATGSRGGLLGLAAGVFFIVVGMRARRLIGAMALVTFAGIVGWQFASPVFKERVLSLADLESDYNVTEDTGRLGTWRRGIGYALDRPITGVGILNFATAEGERLLDLNRAGAWHTAHNSYIQAFAEMGFLGGFLLLAILGSAFKRARRLWRPATNRIGSPFDRPEYLASLVAFSSAGFFLSHAYVYHLFAVLGLALHASLVMPAGVSVRSPKTSPRRRPVLMGQRGPRVGEAWMRAAPSRRVPRVD